MAVIKNLIFDPLLQMETSEENFAPKVLLVVKNGLRERENLESFWNAAWEIPNTTTARSQKSPVRSSKVKKNPFFSLSIVAWDTFHSVGFADLGREIFSAQQCKRNPRYPLSCHAEPSSSLCYCSAVSQPETLSDGSENI